MGIRDNLDIIIRLRETRRALNDSKKVQAGVKGIGREIARADAKARRGARGFGVFNRGQGAAATGARKGAMALRRMAGAAVATAAAYIGIEKARKAVTTVIDLGKATLRLNRQQGLSIEQGAEWAAVTNVRGIATNKLQMSFTALSKQVRAATSGNKTARKAFRDLGISQDDVTRGGHDFNFILRKVMDGLGGMKGGTDRTAIGTQLLGKSAKDLLPIMNEGTKSFDKQAKVAKASGAVLSGDTVNDVNKMIQAQRGWKFASLGLQVTIGSRLLPVLTKLANAGASVLRIFNDPHMALDQKLKKSDAIINPILTSFTAKLPQIAKVLTHVVTAMAPALAEHSATLGLAIAKGMVLGFLHAPILGKLALAAWLVHKMGGFKALTKIGAKAGAKWGIGFLAGAGPEVAATSAAGGGPALTRGNPLAAGATGGARGALLRTLSIAGPVAITALAGIELGLHAKDMRDWIAQKLFGSKSLDIPGVGEMTIKKLNKITRDPTGFAEAQHKALRSWRANHPTGLSAGRKGVPKLTKQSLAAARGSIPGLAGALRVGKLSIPQIIDRDMKRAGTVTRKGVKQIRTQMGALDPAVRGSVRMSMNDMLKQMVRGHKLSAAEATRIKFAINHPLMDATKGLGTSIKDNLVNPLKSVTTGINQGIQNITGLDLTKPPKKPKHPHQASGGVTTRSGWSWVGERGPELRFMPQGARVYPSAQSANVSRLPSREMQAINPMLDTATMRGGPTYVTTELKVGQKVLARAVTKHERQEAQRS